MSLIQEIQVLTADECEELWMTIKALRPLWRARGSDPQFPYFYTLGLTSYLDGHQGQSFLDAVAPINHILHHNFADLYNRLIGALKLLNEERRKYQFDANVSLPGFHIYPRNMPRGGEIHIDRQFWKMPWPDPTLYDFSQIGSLTLAIRLPKSGGGLRYWPSVTASELTIGERLLPKDIGAICASVPFVEKRYIVGCLYFSAANFVHQIAPNNQVLEGEARVTLQAHCIRTRKGAWTLFF